MQHLAAAFDGVAQRPVDLDFAAFILLQIDGFAVEKQNCPSSS